MNPMNPMNPMKKIAVVFALVCVVLPAARIPEQDARNVVLSSSTHYKMPVFASREAWLERAAFLRKQILASAGLLPMPEKTPLNAQIFGKLERDGYSIEKVLLETYPGFYMGGNLYRPRGRQGPFPGIASPHGHWRYGRLENQPFVSVAARCINLARQGFVVFSYDMIGYNDTNQIPHHWGGARETLWSIGPMGLQLWDSIRVVDFLSSLQDVEATQIGVTGASGGGTQTFFLMAVDERIKAAAPVNMISAQMQGGVCENAPNLRAGHTDFSNMVVGALMAPRPLLLVSAGGDWTRNTRSEEFPAIRSIYELLGVEQNVENAHVNQLHNYNEQSRQAVYRFFNARLLDNNESVDEERYQIEQPQDLLVLHNRQRPANAINLEQLMERWIADAQRSVEQLRPRDASSLERAEQAFHERLTFSLLASKPAPDALLSEKMETAGPEEALFIGRAGKGDRVPAVWLVPAKPNPRVAPTVVVHPEGSAWVLRSSQSANGLVKGILSRGGAVLGIDAFQTGTARAPRDTDSRAFVNFNQTNDACRLQDILTAIGYARKRSQASTVNLVGLEMAGVWSYFARAMADQHVNLVADLAQFRAETDSEYVSRFFIPGLRKAGDFRAAATLNAQGKVLLHNASSEFPAEWAKNATRLAGSTLEVRTSPASDSEILAWLAQNVSIHSGN